MLDTIAVRPSVKSDMAAVDAVLARSYPALLKADYAPSVLVSALPIISRARPELITCGTYYVAKIAGPGSVGAGSVRAGIVGAGGWTAKRWQPGVVDIRHVVTDHRRTRQGHI